MSDTIDLDLQTITREASAYLRGAEVSQFSVFSGIRLEDSGGGSNRPTFAVDMNVPVAKDAMQAFPGIGNAQKENFLRMAEYQARRVLNTYMPRDRRNDFTLRIEM